MTAIANEGTTAEETTAFGDLGLGPEVLAALVGLGYEEPTPIQSEAIPPLLDGRDLLGQAATGTGKTAAFALPLLERLLPRGKQKAPGALVLVPTRELAIQVSEAIHRYGRQLGARVLPIYGGQPIGRQLAALERGIDVVVATPGRVLDHIGRGTLPLAKIKIVVLDEADEMMDMGFAEDIEAILNATPAERQTVLFSATMPPRIDAMARRHLRDPVSIKLGLPQHDPGAAPRVRQLAYVVPRAFKTATLGRILDVESPAAAIVFCRTRAEVDKISETLNARGYRSEALHGGMTQEQRDRVMGRLRSGAADLIVATDVAARGLDIEQLTHVFNYEVPASPDSYVHRIGRVGRAGREGVAITLVEPREHRMLKTIERVTKQRVMIEKVPTVADLRTRRLELTRAALEESIVQDELESFRVVVETLADTFDVVEVAMAAVKLAYESGGAGAEQDEIPEVAPVVARTIPTHKSSARATGSAGREPSSGRSVGGRPTGGRPAQKGPRSSRGRTTQLFIGAGREVGVRPQDLVGAITGETQLSGRDIGAIEISDRYSLVEVPEGAADEVIASLRQTTIKGSRPTVRRSR